MHLDDEGADDSDRITAELNPLLSKEPPSSEDEPRILELLTQLEHALPPHFNGACAESLAFRRALALRQMGKLGLALLEMKDARQARPDDPMFAFVYLDLLRLEDLPSAVSEANPSPKRRMCPPLSCRRASTSSACRRNKWPTVSSTRSPNRSSPGVAVLIRPRSRSSRAVARGVVLLQSRTCPPSSGPNLLARQAFESAQQHVSRRPDARRSHRAPDL